MARSRYIKPGFFTNEELVELDPLTRLLFAGLWCIADREGRLEDRPKKIKIGVLPADNCNVDAMLSELNSTGFIVRYGDGDKRYIQINKFRKHQNPHIKEAPSTIPAPTEHGSDPVEHKVTSPKERPSPNPGSDEHLTSTVQAWGLHHASTNLGDGEPCGEWGMGNGELESSPAGEPRARAPSKRKPPDPDKNLAPLFGAFDERDLPRPVVTGPEARAAATLMKHVPESEIAECWADIRSGRYGDDFDQKRLSFDYLTRQNRIGNWQSWRDNSSPQSSRASPRDPDLCQNPGCYSNPDIRDLCRKPRHRERAAA